MFIKRSLLAIATCLAFTGINNEVEASSEASSLKTCSRCRLLSGWGMGTAPEAAFDAEKIKTIQGDVVSVQDLPSEAGVVGGVYVLLKTESGNVPVRLGPASVVTAAGLSIEPYDTLTVIGSEIDTDDHKGMIATQVCKGSDSVQLRTKAGAIAWR